MTAPHQTLLHSIWAVQSGTVARDALIAAAETRAAALEPWLKAFCYLPEKRLTQDAATGPLAGIPVGVKDIIATADMPTTNGSPVYAGVIPATDAAIVTQIKHYGGTVFGKTVSTEFAWREPGPTVNPWNRAHSPGGSSSGSAASVAAGIVPLALGSQTMGSIIRPAAFNGVVGYKASFGAVAREGAHPLAGSLDHIGFFTRSVADAAAAFALFVAQTPEMVRSEVNWQHYFSPKSAPKLAVMRTGVWARASVEQQGNFAAQLAALRNAGAELVEYDLPEDTGLILQAANDVLHYEAAQLYRDLIAAHPGKTSAHLKQLVADGLAVSEARYQAALALQARLRAGLEAWISPCDAILTLPATGQAPRGLNDTGDAAFCVPWSLLGVPALNLPSGWSADGLPLGLQLVGAFGNDKKTLEVAAWVEGIIRFEERIVA